MTGWTPDQWSAYEAGLVAGYAIGADEESASRDAPWLEAARPIARGGPEYAELEERRYGPGGRARAGDARPGDLIGRDKEPARAAEAARERRVGWEAAAVAHQARQRAIGKGRGQPGRGRQAGIGMEIAS